MKTIILTDESFRNLEAGTKYQYQTITFEVVKKTACENASPDYTVILNGEEKTMKIGKLKSLVGCTYKKEYKINTQGGVKLSSLDVIDNKADTLKDKLFKKFEDLQNELIKYGCTDVSSISEVSINNTVANWTKEQIDKLEAIRIKEAEAAQKKAEEAAQKAQKIAEISAKINEAVSSQNWTEVNKLSAELKKLTK